MKRKNPNPLIKTIPIGRRTNSPYTDIVKIKTETNGLNVIKLSLILLVLLIELALFILLHIFLAFSYSTILLISFCLSVITCIYVLSSRKNSHSKAVWIIFLLLFFPVAYIFYLMSDERILFGVSGKRYKRIFKRTEKYFDEKNAKSDDIVVQNNCNYLYNAGGFTTYSNTKVQYFSSGASFFDDVIERLKDAKKYIFIEFFIISDGVLLKRVLDVLTEKVKQGVDVRIIYDDFGCRKALSRKTKTKIRNLGIKMLPFNKLTFVFSLILNFRDHRKIMVIDGQTAYTGGCNLADEYVNEKRIHGYWKDAGVRLDGSAVDGFSLIFLRQWEFLNKKREGYSKFLNLYQNYPNDAVVVPYADGLDYSASICKNVYENMIASANKTIYIMTPYFIVDDAITELLISKAISGVDVRIVIPEIPDKAFVYGVTRNNAEKLIDYGVSVYCMKNSFVHSKLVLTDTSVAIGSANMDLRSFYQQFECAVYTDDKDTREKVLQDFNQTFKDSVLITEKNKLRKHVIYRIFAGVMQIFAPFM
ncbi:MAG: cardiolipin synthase [Clostridiales bacterium]|nr:cardiolipin synthase [Clostridiales bacterium]